MKWILLILLCGFSWLAQAGALQNVQGRAQLSLNGQWNAIVDPFDVGDKRQFFASPGQAKDNMLQEFDFTDSQKLQVPGDWNTQDNKLFFYEGTVWYQRNFLVTKESRRHYFLHFDAVNYLATVYLNGELLGQHEGGFTPFQFEVSDKLVDGDNSVVVKVNNRREADYVPTMSTDWWNYGGITRPVRLIAEEPVYVSDYAFTLNENGGITRPVRLIAEEPVYVSDYAFTLNANGGITASVSLAGDEAGNQTVALSMPGLNSHTKIRTNNDGEATVTFNAAPELWRPQHPVLSSVEIKVGDTVITDRIGFRTVRVDGEDILLNGEPVFLKGIAIHEEKPFGDGRAWSEEDARTLLGWAKELGANYVRLAHYPHNEHMLRVADELGLLVWAEIPVYWDIQFDNEAVYKKAEQQFAEMMDRDKNRAAIILWSIANETPITEARTAFLGRLADAVRTTDPTRLVTAAINTQTTTDTGRKIEEAFAASVDVIGINTYCGWYHDEPETCAEYRWESDFNKPIIVSEFGAGALQGRHGNEDEFFTEEYQARVYKHNLTMLENMKQLRGVSPWILKDFRSPRRPRAHVQDYWNRKGLLSENGQKKQVWYIMKDWYENH